MTYSEKLSDPRWQKKRLAVLKRAGWMCQLCGNDKLTLHVHHPRYVKGREPWDYTNLIALCECCHAARHQKAPEPQVDMLWRLAIRDARNGNPDAKALLREMPAETAKLLFQ